MAFTFRGGAHPPTHKDTATANIVILPPPAIVAVPLAAHIGVPAKPLVEVGDYVAYGQKIGDAEGLCAPVHASVSGKVIDLHKRRLANGRNVDDLLIENDGLDTLADTVRPCEKPIGELTFDDVVALVREAGICGMGGACFPTAAKLLSARDKAKHLIVNCAECEPYLTANHRLLVETPQDVVRGMKLLLAAMKIPYGILAIEDNKRDAAACADTFCHEDDTVKIQLVKTKYPQGDERQLIFALSGKEVPAGKLPADIGFLVLNAETCAAIWRAYIDGMPSVSRIVTVAGDCIAEPKNLLVRIGTPLKALIDFCGGYTATPRKVLVGGPMMGQAMWNMETPVGKGTAGVLCLSGVEDTPYLKHSTCIRCGRCVKGCPMHLMPSYLAQFSRKKQDDMCVQFDIANCVECGTCTYLCPANVPIVQYIRVAKGRIADARRAMEAGKKTD